MDKKYNQKELAQFLAKSLWKSFKKALYKKNPIQDVLDPNNKPEARRGTIPAPRESVMYKSKKLKDFIDKKNKKRKAASKPILELGSKAAFDRQFSDENSDKRMREKIHDSGDLDLLNEDKKST